MKRAAGFLSEAPSPERDAALESLIELGPRAAELKPRLWKAVASERISAGSRAAVDALLAIGITPADEPKVRELLQGELPEETRRYLRFELGEGRSELDENSRSALARLRAREIDPLTLWKHPQAAVRAEALDAMAADSEVPPSAKVTLYLKALGDEARLVRMTAVRQLAALPPSVWLTGVQSVLGEKSAVRRSAACELIELSSAQLVAARTPLKRQLAELMRKIPETESWNHSAQTAWLALGVNLEDREPLRRLLESTKLSAARRAQVIRLVAQLGASGGEFVAPLVRLLSTNASKAQAWYRVGVDGDLTAAAEALARLAPYADAKSARFAREALGRLASGWLSQATLEKTRLALSRLPSSSAT